MSTASAEKPLCVLSLDGGGVRGLSELLIVEQLMLRLQEQRQSEHPPKPCEVFDLICGTSTGGIIALMLGRLRMTVQEVKDQYCSISESVFGHPKRRVGKGGDQFSATKLEEAMKETIAKFGVCGSAAEAHDPELKLLEGSLTTVGCKVFVCARNARAMNMIRLFRSYKTYDTGTYENMTIWQAGRATSAAPTFFKRLEIGQKNMQEEFLDGGLGSNNPTKFLLEEMAHIYENREVSCIISIGAGKAKIREYRKPGFVGKLLPKALVEALESLATDCEETEADMSKKFMNSPNLYFRFNVDRGLEEVGLEEWKELGNITSKTNQYLLDHRLGPVISDAVLQLHKPTSKLTATYLSPSLSIPAAMTAAVDDSTYMDQVIGNKLKDADEIEVRFQKLYFEHMHARNELVKPAFSSTFQWLLDPIEDTRAHGSPFRRWLSSPSHGKDIFWLSGKAGSGKSTLMKYLHSHAMLKELLKPWMASHKTSQIALAGFYFHERGKVDLQKSREGLIRSILLQLLAQVPSMKYVVLDPDDRKKLVQPSESTEFSWTWKQLRKALLCFMREKPQSLAIYIYADGLDEYLNTETLNQGLRDDDEGSTGQFISQKSKGHREISESFLELAEFCNTKICLSSRPLTAFDDNFGDFSRLKLEDLTRHDITLFVSEKLGTASARNKICSQELETIVRMTVQAASGVFLWVVLVVENLIRRMSDGDTIEELKTWLRNTPEELIGVDGLYMRMLQDIAPHDRRQGQHYLEVVRNARHQVSPLLLSFSEDTRKEVLEVLYRYLTDEELRMRLNRIQSRLKSRCAGLLELHQRSHTFVSSPTLITPRLQTFTFSEGLKLQSPFWCHSNIVVDFFHQTAKEFVQSRKVQRILEANYIFDYRSLTYACIRRIKCLRIHPRDDVEFWAHLKDAMIYAQATELATGKPDVEVLDHLDFAANRALQDVARSLQTKDYRAPLELKYGFLHYGYHWSIMERQAHEGRIYSWRDDFLSWAVQANLSLYLNAKMSESGYIQKVGRPLLAYAVAPPPMSSVQQHSGAYRDEFGKYMSSPKTVEILLKNGESPNEVHMGRTIWQLILQQAIRAPPYGCQDEIAVTKVMRLMLRAGADPNAKYWYHRSLLYTVLMFGIAPQAERKIRVRSLVKHGAVLFIGEKESIRQTRDLEWAHSPMQEWQEQVAPTAMEWEAWERGFEAAAPQVDAVSDTNSGDQRTGRISKRRPAETKTLKADVEDQYRDLPNLDLQDPDLNNADADPVDQSAGQWKCSTM